MSPFDSPNAEAERILAQLPHLHSIQGWLLVVEAVALFKLSTQIASLYPIICEIGSRKGKSSYVLASGLRRKTGRLYCIDPFDGRGDEASKHEYRSQIDRLTVSLRALFDETMSRCGVFERISVIPMTSQNARSVFMESRIDLLFIDGNHDFEAVKLDYGFWSPLIPSGGTIVLHDVGARHVDGPRRVMEDMIINNPMWTQVHTVGEMGIATRA